MMVVDRAAGTITHRRFRDFPESLRPDDLLVLNDTRVVAARFFSNDGRREILRVEMPGERLWKCLVKPGKKFKPGHTIEIGECIGTVTSIGGEVTPPHLWPYAVAKSGAVAFSEGLSAELSGTGVTATTVVPGLMRTGSHERAHFTGQADKEYAWFGPAASLPLLTMSADRAARRIVDAVLAGDTRCELTPLTVVATRFRGLLPGVTTRMMGLTSRLLPSASGPGETIEGREAGQRLGSRVVDTLTTLGSRAARRNNERRPTTQAQEP